MVELEKKTKLKKSKKNLEDLGNVVRRRPRTRSMSEVDDTIDDKPKLEEDPGDFSNFKISKKTVKKLIANGVNKLFPVQYTTYNAILDGSDVIVQARTGTGKTLGFALPVLEKLKNIDSEQKRKSPLVLTLAPTRELAIQICKEVEKYKPRQMTISCFYGGAPYDKQEQELRNGIDFLVGTPGRILDHINKGRLDVSKLQYVILDEADRMMDMGFQESMEEILSYAYTEDNKPQTLLFSATVPAWLQKNSEKYLTKNLKKFDLIGRDKNKGATTVEHKAIKCTYWDRPSTIKDIIQQYSGKFGKTIIFTSTKQEANELALNSVINMDSQVLHGDIQQKQRELTLQSFRNGKFNCLIATDVAARGLDIPEVDLVIQTEPPKDVDSYIHRAGRTGRAGRKGVCIIFYKPGQEYGVAAVEHKAGISFTRIGAPQQKDLIAASAEDAVRSLDEVKEDVISYFLDCARDLIEKRGAEKALAAALAYISGTTEIVNRSMLTSQPGYTTYLMKQNLELRSTGLIWHTLRRYFDQTFIDSIKGMRICKDKLGCVFDVPTESIKVIEECWKGDKFSTLEPITELPELMEGVQGFQNNTGAGYRGSNSGSWNNGNNRGGNGGFGNKRTFSQSNSYNNSSNKRPRNF
ncbi:nucleolar RNA helicase 2 isoform X1 [Hydra vulgaris]|uniref:RNA helicase n=1 Tax=Hydra vulgaris TaxID=6087 RepID=T2M5C3_HYDVU|nr:nucleolar RNA helicase 2 [Hydra vulgaris]